MQKQFKLRRRIKLIFLLKHREKAFIDKIKAERDKEVVCNKKMLYLEIVNFVLTAFSPTMVLIATIGIFIYMGMAAELTAEKFFVSIALFDIL